MNQSRNLNAPHHTCSDLGPYNYRQTVFVRTGGIVIRDGYAYRARTAMVPAARYV